MRKGGEGDTNGLNGGRIGIEREGGICAPALRTNAKKAMRNRNLSSQSA